MLTAYAFFASAGTFDFPRVPWNRDYSRIAQGYYASLAEGYRQGRLSMAHEPAPILKALHDPYTAKVRDRYGAPFLWDASYYHGRYYLYFSPLPVLLFYLPFRAVRGAYPLDELAGAVFCAWAFLMAVLTLRRALAGRALHLPCAVWVLVIGLANVIPFTLTHVRTYEVAIVAGMALSATWAYALLRFTETGLVRHAFWMGLWLALSIAARPNLGMLLLTAPFVIPWRNRRAWLAWIVPLALTAAAMGAYNRARFGDVRETGVTWQLTSVPMREHRVCAIRNSRELMRAINHTVHYAAWTPGIWSEFPYADLQPQRLDPLVSFPGGMEAMVGVGPVNPFTMIATLFAGLLLASRRAIDTMTRAGLRILASAWLVLFGLSACWYVVARYTLDFAMLMAIGAAIVVEAALTLLQDLGFAMRPLRIAAIAFACWAVLIGTLLGFSGPFYSFQDANPKLFRALYEATGGQKPPAP